MNQIVKYIIVYILSFHSLKVQIDESLSINLHKTYNDCILLQTFTSIPGGGFNDSINKTWCFIDIGKPN